MLKASLYYIMRPGLKTNPNPNKASNQPTNQPKDSEDSNCSISEIRCTEVKNRINFICVLGFLSLEAAQHSLSLAVNSLVMVAQSDVFFGHSHQTHDENFQNSHVTNYSGSLPAWNIKCLFFLLKRQYYS